MAKDAELTVKIGANSKAFSKELDKVGRDVKKRNEFLSNLDKKQKAEFIARERKLSELIDKRNAALKRGAAIGFAAVAAGLVIATQRSIEFEKSFANVVTLLDDTSFAAGKFETGVGGLKKGLKELRSESGETFGNLNKGLFDIVSAGVDAGEAIDVLRVATELAIAGATDTSVAVDGITSALNAYELEAGNAEYVSIKFFNAQKFGKTTVEELSRGFGTVAATASSFGVSMDELLASVAAATTGGIQTSQAYTGLAAILANISKPTKDAADEASRLGIEFNSTALRSRGLKGFLDSVTGSANFNATSMEKLFGSVEAVKTVLALTGAGADDFEKILGKLADKEEAAATKAAALAAQNDTVAQKSKKAKGAIELMAIAIGDELAPSMGDLSGATSDLAPVLTEILVPAIKLVVGELTRFIGHLNTVIKGISDFAKITTDGFGVIILSAYKLTGALNDIETPKLKDLKTTLSIDTDQPKPLDFEAGAQEFEAFKANIARKKKIKEDERKSEEEAEQKAFEANKTRAEISALLDNENRTASEEQHLQSLIKKEQADIETETRKRDRAILANLLDNENRTADEEASLNSLLAKEANEIEIEERKLERDQEKREAKLELEQEQFEEDLERLNERLSGKRELEDEFTSLVDLKEAERLKNKAKGTKDEDKADKAFAKAKIKTGQEVTASLIASTTELFDKKTAIGQAAAIADKAMRISESIQFTYTGATRALADYPAPYSYGVAAATVAAGLANVATISGAADGGMVHGGVFGRDTEPFLLAKGEAIVPSKLNPLSTDFEGEFGEGGLGGFGGGQNVQVEISLTDDAARFITAGQREDSALGV